MTVLLVEDETFTRLMLVAELEAHGHTVVEVADADQAVSVLRDNSSVRLVFTDIKMPGTMDGLDLARLVRAEYPRLKVIIGSAHAGLSDWAAEADATFAKPYELERVVLKVDQLARACVQ
jgi:CheY-like chemotaxis protein